MLKPWENEALIDLGSSLKMEDLPLILGNLMHFRG
jgi:hypothetical protein